MADMIWAGQADEVPTTAEVHREHPPAPASADVVLDLVERSRGTLLQACCSTCPDDRFITAHLGALRAAAALLAARTVPSRRSRPRSVWEMLPAVAPELTEWAIFFGATGRRRQLVEQGRHRASAREADDLVRQAEMFLEIVRASLGLPVAAPLPGVLVAGPA